MKGLGRHYSTTEQHQVTGHGLFMGLHVVLGRRCPLPPQMYRTQATCEKEGGPFKSKVDRPSQKASIGKIREQIGWQPQRSLRDALQDALHDANL